MFETTTQLGAAPVIEPGSSAADAIEQALDRAQKQSEIDAILTRVLPYTTTFLSFDRLGRIKCRRAAGEHIDQAPIPVTINSAMVTALGNSIPLTIGVSLLASVQAAAEATITNVKATSVTTVATNTGTARRIANEVRTQLAQGIGLTKTLSVTYHADECFERNNPYGLCLEITVSGRLTFRQDAVISRGNDGLFRYKLLNSGVISEVTQDDIDASLDPCVMPDESPTRIPGCERLQKVGSRLPVESIDGVGGELGGKLRANGILTVGDLADVDIDASFEGIARNALLAVRAKARMLVGVSVDAAHWAAMADHSAGEILDTPPESLRAAPGEPQAIEGAMRVREDLATMLVSLDDELVRGATLSELSSKLDIVNR